MRLEFEGGGLVEAECAPGDWLAVVSAADGDWPSTLTWLSRDGVALERVALPPMAPTIDDRAWRSYAPIGD